MSITQFSDPPSKESSIEAIGVIIPEDWDEEGTPVAVALATYQEETFILDKSTPGGRELQDLIHQKVRVTGTLYLRADGRATLRVSNFSVEKPLEQLLQSG